MSRKRLNASLRSASSTHLGVGAAELEPDLDHALGGLVGDLPEALVDVLGDGLGNLVAHLVLGGLGLHLARRRSAARRGGNPRCPWRSAPGRCHPPPPTRAGSGSRRRRAGRCARPCWKAAAAPPAPPCRRCRRCLRSGPGPASTWPPPLAGIDAVRLAGIGADDAGDGRPIAATEEEPACTGWRARRYRPRPARCACRSPCRRRRRACSIAFLMASERYTRSAAVVASSCARSREASDDHSCNQLDSSRTWPMASSTCRSMMSSRLPRRHSSATSAR